MQIICSVIKKEMLLCLFVFIDILNLGTVLEHQQHKKNLSFQALVY